MTAYGFTLFDTTIGRCGIVWSVRGIASVQLPEARERDTRARILQRFPNAHEASPPSNVKHAIDGIVALLCGEASDLSGIVLDMACVPPFYRRVYEVARTIAPGATLSYGDVALRLGAPGSARAVGQALGEIHSRLSCRVIEWSRPVVSLAASLRTAASRQSFACSRLKALK
jgi:methylated-DNA-[protein]-cysteine S-methyltransferase